MPLRMPRCSSSRLRGQMLDINAFSRCTASVSYTHLDVYKRQAHDLYEETMRESADLDISAVIEQSRHVDTDRIGHLTR